MNKNSLHNGLVVELKSGFRYLVLDGFLTNKSRAINLDSYDEELKDISPNNPTDIVEIFKVKNICFLGDIFNDENLELVWKREDIKNVDWSKVKRNTKILVSNDKDVWFYTWFLTYNAGTSHPFIAKGRYTNEIYRCKYAKLEEEN